MITYLMQFNLTVKYIKGVKNLTADALSRVFNDMSYTEKLLFAQKFDEKDDFVLAVDKPFTGHTGHTEYRRPSGTGQLARQQTG